MESVGTPNWGNPRRPPSVRCPIAPPPVIFFFLIISIIQFIFAAPQNGHWERLPSSAPVVLRFSALSTEQTYHGVKLRLGRTLIRRHLEEKRTGILNALGRHRIDSGTGEAPGLNKCKKLTGLCRRNHTLTLRTENPSG